MSAAEFHAIVNPLAISTNRTLDDETWSLYHDKLADVPADTLKGAVGRLLSSAKYFPSIGEIRASCDLMSAGTRFQTFSVPALVPDGVLPDDDPRLWYACTTCQDSGWAPNWCPGSVHAEAPPQHEWASVRPCGSNACARFGAKGYGHEFASRCPCYTSNKVIRARLDSRKTYAEQA